MISQLKISTQQLYTLLTTLKTRPNVTAMIMLAFWSIASRGLGALRILLVGRFSTQEADIFNAAFVLPDNIIAVFILGSITLAILPHAIELSHKDTSSESESKSEKITKTNQSIQPDTSAKLQISHKEAIYLTHTTLYLAVFISGITLLCLLFTSPLLKLLNPKLYINLIEFGQWDQYITLTRILLLAPLIFATKTIFGAYLNAHRKFEIYALDGVITNIGILFGLTVLYSYYGIVGAIWGVIIGFLASCIAFGIDAFRHGLRLRLDTFEGLNDYLLKTLTLYLPRLLIIPAIRIAETMVTLTASAADGQITALRTALDLQGIPLGLITVAAVVFLPDITAIFVRSGFGTELKELLKKYTLYGAACGLVGGIAIAAGTPALFWILRYIKFIEANSFFDSANNIRLIGICTTITALSLMFQIVIEFYNRAYVALKNTSIPLISSVVGTICGVTATFVLVNITGAAIATALGFSLNAVVQSIISVGFFEVIGNKTKDSHPLTT